MLCLTELTAVIIETKPEADVVEGTVKWLKSKMKDWKDSNMNMIKGSLALIRDVAKDYDNVNKRTMRCAMPFLCEKMGDIKYCGPAHDAMLYFCEMAGPKFVLFEMMKYCGGHKAVKVVQESCNFMTKAIDEFSIIGMPIKEMIEYFLVAISSPNAQVRTAATNFIKMLYQHAGDLIRNFLDGIKDSTLKVIEDELSKTEQLPKEEIKSKRLFRGAALAEKSSAKGPAGKGGAGGGGAVSAAALLDDALGPRENISKAIAKILPVLSDKDPKKRKQGADLVEGILKGARMRILPDGLGDFVDQLK